MKNFWVRLRICFFVMFRMPDERIGQRILNRLGGRTNSATLYYMTDTVLLSTLKKEI
jgi:hypothetical protein